MSLDDREISPVALVQNPAFGSLLLWSFGKAYQAENPELDLASVVPDDLDDEDMRDALEVGKKLTFKMAHLRVDDWLLYALDSPSASGARGFGRGSVFSRDGRLVASTAQEGLVRVVSA